MNPILAAVEYAWNVHRADSRKFNGEPYFYHCLRVMNETMIHPMAEKYVLAAACHDIIEDHPEPTPEDAYANLSKVIGVEATIVVGELTNRFTSDQYPDMNRAARKAAEVRRLSACSDEVKIIKMYDRIDNLRSFDFKEMVDMEPRTRKKAIGFGRTYGAESIKLFEAIGDADPFLREVGIELATQLL